MNHPRVFISYCHTDEIYEQKMFEFANKLRKNGIVPISIYLKNVLLKDGHIGWKSRFATQILCLSYVARLTPKNFMPITEKV